MTFANSMVINQQPIKLSSCHNLSNPLTVLNAHTMDVSRHVVKLSKISIIVITVLYYISF